MERLSHDVYYFFPKKVENVAKSLLRLTHFYNNSWITLAKAISKAAYSERLLSQFLTVIL